MSTIDEQLYKILNEYMDELGDEAKLAFKQTGKDTSENLKQTSKSLFHHKAQKHYADGWTYKVSGTKLNLIVKIYNKTKPGLTHLLENGHIKLIRGRNYGRSKAVKHIEPAEQKATNELLERLSR